MAHDHLFETRPPTTYIGSPGKTLIVIAGDGKVMLSPDVDLADLTALPRPYLLLLRELVNTAIYDQERGR